MFECLIVSMSRVRYMYHVHHASRVRHVSHLSDMNNMRRVYRSGSQLKNLFYIIYQTVIEAQPTRAITFIKLHAPWPVLCRYAEELSLRAPLQVAKLFLINIYINLQE